MSRFLYTEEYDKFLIENVKGISLQELTRRFNEKFGLNKNEMSIANRKHILGLKSGYNSTQFVKGQDSWNKGKTWDETLSKDAQKRILEHSFKKGHRNSWELPLLTERTDKHGVDYIKVKEPNVWIPKSRYLYSKYKGEIPEGYSIIFLDGNKHNFELDNLELANNSEICYLTTHKLRFGNKELTKTALNIAKVDLKAKQIEKRRKLK